MRAQVDPCTPGKPLTISCNSTLSNCLFEIGIHEIKEALISNATPTPAPPATTITPWIPAFRWLAGYKRAWLLGDVLAGVTLAAYLLPAAIGDASLAGLPPEAGLYACLFSGLTFWLFCSSKHTVISVTSAISLLLGASLGGMAGGDPGRFGALASGTALLVAVIASLPARSSGRHRELHLIMSWSASCGVAPSSPAPVKLCGFHGRTEISGRIAHFLQHMEETNAASLIIGACPLQFVLGKVFLKHKPTHYRRRSILVSSLMNLKLTCKPARQQPQGLRPRLPAIQWSDLNELLAQRLACFLLGVVETAAIGRMVAKHRGRFNANQSLSRWPRQMLLPDSPRISGEWRHVATMSTKRVAHTRRFRGTPLSLSSWLFCSSHLLRSAPACFGSGCTCRCGGPVQIQTSSTPGDLTDPNLS